MADDTYVEDGSEGSCQIP